MTDDKPDFDALRAARNAAARARTEKIADELGWPLQALHSTHNNNACYCACTTGGPCEHKWDGEPYESADGACWSATCSRCGTTAMSHSLRTSE